MFDNKKVIITFTTIPSRFPYLGSLIFSLQNQTIPVDEIVLSIPKESIREPYNLNLYSEDIIKQYQNMGITILRVSKDYGPATKILGLLERELDQHTKDTEPIIITVDDDKVYSKHIVSDLLNQYTCNQNSVLCRKGIILRKINKNSIAYQNSRYYQAINYYETPVRGCDISTNLQVNTLLGTGGVLYKPSFFDSEIFNIPIKDDIIFMDDLYLSGYLSQKQIKIIVCSFPKTRVINILENKQIKIVSKKSYANIDIDNKNRNINPLKDINTKKSYDNYKRISRCIDYYKEYIVTI